jgi:hypothetical protein
MNRLVLALAAVIGAASPALADDPPAPAPAPTDSAAAPALTPDAPATQSSSAPPAKDAVAVIGPDTSIKADPTGGAYTSPTLLFIPAAAVPAWNVRVITSLDMQGPTAADRLASGTSLGFQPGIGGELGLPGGFTVGAGTQWVGGDAPSGPSAAPFGQGISPYLQARYNIFGDKATGQGLGIGTSLTYKFVGFQGDPGEMELALSAQYRQKKYEVGLQAVFGKDFATVDADAEGHAYAIYRIIPELGVGAAVQYRKSAYFFGPAQPGDTTFDVISGGIASFTYGRWQLGTLVGESTVGLNQGQAGFLGELFGTARF